MFEKSNVRFSVVQDSNGYLCSKAGKSVLLLEALGLSWLDGVVVVGGTAVDDVSTDLDLTTVTSR